MHVKQFSRKVKVYWKRQKMQKDYNTAFFGVKKMHKVAGVVKKIWIAIICKGKLHNVHLFALTCNYLHVMQKLQIADEHSQ